MRLYRSLIQPIALYGCETWTLRTKEEAMLNVFEMAALWKIAGVKLVNRIRIEKLGQTRTRTKGYRAGSTSCGDHSIGLRSKLLLLLLSLFLLLLFLLLLFLLLLFLLLLFLLLLSTSSRTSER